MMKFKGSQSEEPFPKTDVPSLKRLNRSKNSLEETSDLEDADGSPLPSLREHQHRMPRLLQTPNKGIRRCKECFTTPLTDLGTLRILDLPPQRLWMFVSGMDPSLMIYYIFSHPIGVIKVLRGSVIPDVEMDEVIMQQYARAYLLFVLGCTIFADGTGNKIHGCWLYLLSDFDEAGRYSWGSAALAHLYRALYRGSVLGQRTSAGSAGFFALLQLWSWERLHVGRPTLQEEDFVLGDRPLGARWNIFQRFDENTRVLMWYRAQLDYQDQSQVVWQPYVGKYESLPPVCRDHHMMWLARVPLICFDIVEMHLPDRVARQFGWHQDIPADVEDIDRVNRRGRQDVNWMDFHQSYIERWDQHDEHIHQFPRIRNSRGYMEWYWERTVRHITPPPPPRRPPGYIAQVPVTIAHDINEVLARGAVLYPDSSEAGRIAAVTRDLAEAMVEDREQSHDQSSYVASMYDRIYDDVSGADFSESEPMFTFEELFSDLVHLEQDVHDQSHQPDDIPQHIPHVPHRSSMSTRPLQTYVRGPRRLFGISGVARRSDEFTTPAQPMIPSSQPTDAPSSSAPPAPRKTKLNVWKKVFG
ncbi:hypothetical protein QJS10_CPA01g01878 [Acorus calamus]|uniref:Aminotransferase-like plant mobile domain-containing protein n=1 Tax=Acorus calamus TaxID=4465 RepID=A0AAV9FKL9_ACOCL|nr:hypothetical protein QJS10_CPA01g01878 [Acorus calamus]